jgi:hypothetical protein
MESVDVLDKDDVLDLIRQEGASADSIDEIWKGLDAVVDGMAKINDRLESLSQRIDDYVRKEG